MSKTVDKLWKLINSLSMSEKRYFKIYAKKDAAASNNYIRLFDVVAKQEVYNEEAIRKHFEGEKFLKQLHVTKHYLYQLILRSLRSFNMGKSIESKTTSYFQDIKLLFSKGLIKECKQEINKAKSYLEAHEKYLDLFRLAEWEKGVHYELYENRSINFLKESFKKEQQLLDQVANLSQYRHLKEALVGELRESSGIWPKELRKKTNAYLSHPLLQDKSRAITFRSEVIYYELHALCYHIQYDWKKLETTAKIALSLMETNPVFMQNNMTAYLGLMAKYCLSLNKEPEKMDLFFQALKKLKGLQINERPLRLRATVIHNFVLARVYRNSGNKKKGFLLAQEMENWLEKNASMVKKNTLILVYSDIADLFFLNDNYEAALDYLNKILAIKILGICQEEQRFARLRLLIVYIELGYFDLLEYASRSLCRLLKKTKYVYELERVFVRFIHNDLSQSISAFDFRQKCKHCLHELNKILAAEPDESFALVSFNFVAWLESKASGTTYAETLNRTFFKKEQLQRKVQSR